MSVTRLTSSPHLLSFDLPPLSSRARRRERPVSDSPIWRPPVGHPCTAGTVLGTVRLSPACFGRRAGGVLIAAAADFTGVDTGLIAPVRDQANARTIDRILPDLASYKVGRSLLANGSEIFA
ncbi:hypothetical protein MRX96_030642 [Rhipicephalus microplus]